MLRILLIGKNGQLGWELQRTLATLGEVIAFDYPEIDLGKPNRLRDMISSNAPQLIINAAAYTNVDKAESEPKLARAVNAIAPGVIAQEAKRINAALIHYSTDYVFDGTKGAAYVEEDKPNPLNVYGRTKLEGEEYVQDVGGAYLIFRTSWVYSLRQGGFVAKVLQWARQQEIMRIVDDQIANPTWARMLAEATSQVVAQGRFEQIEFIKENAGLYHLAGGGAASRYDWARAIVEMDPNKQEQVVKQIVKTNSNEFQTPAIRPNDTRLSMGLVHSVFNIYINDWKDQLRNLWGFEGTSYV